LREPKHRARRDDQNRSCQRQKFFAPKNGNNGRARYLMKYGLLQFRRWTNAAELLTEPILKFVLGLEPRVKIGISRGELQRFANVGIGIVGRAWTIC
jgi:hypothetical protein